MNFTADSKGFYFKEKPFTPHFQSNIGIVALCAHLSHDLNWENEVQKAHGLVAEGKMILWEIDLGFSKEHFNPQEAASFFSFSIAIEEFVKTVLPLFKESTFGICLYRGSVDVTSYFSRHIWEETFEEWIEEQCGQEVASMQRHHYSVFCSKVFAEYLQRLISFLPDDLLAFAIFDVSQEESPSATHQKLSRARFEYLHILIEKEGTIFTTTHHSSLGICLPTDPYINASTLEKMDGLIQQLQETGVEFRVIPELKLTEEWNELDHLIVIPEAISAQGKRKLLGFSAAGGVILEASIESLI